MTDAAPSLEEKEPTRSETIPRLHPAPGRCIVRIVPRIMQAETEEGIALELDGRYENQPMVGQLQEIGDPTSEREKFIADWAITQMNAGALFIFSVYGAGSPYWNEHMAKLAPAGYDFTWLQGLRLFDISQLAATIEGSGTFGENVRLPEDSYAWRSAEDPSAS